MEAVIRKRVTKVGSGAWSIYLPKKWIDAWTPAQQEGREVDLRYISESILVTPVLSEEAYEVEAPDQPDVVRMLLLSGYIRGYNRITLHPADQFGNDTIAMARDFLRHLDERIVADCRPDAIQLRLQADMGSDADAADVLGVLASKVSETLRLAADAIASYAHDPDRTLHALRLLRDTKQEDVDRLFYQAARLVATLGIPLESVSQYQLLGLVASDLQRVSEQATRMGQTILKDLGLEEEDLDYPRAHLLERIRNPRPPTGVAKELHGVTRRGFETLDGLLKHLMEALSKADVPALVVVGMEAAQARRGIQDDVLRRVAEHWGTQTEPEEALVAFTASKHATNLQNAFDHVESICHQATGLLAAT